MKITGKQIIAVLLIFMALSNMILYAMGKVSGLWFWGVILFCAVMTWMVFPRKK